MQLRDLAFPDLRSAESFSLTRSWPCADQQHRAVHPCVPEERLVVDEVGATMLKECIDALSRIPAGHELRRRALSQQVAVVP